MLRVYNKKERVLAAKIQQKFDCDVFELQWNKYAFGTQPTVEEIDYNAKSSNDEDFIIGMIEKFIQLIESLQL